MAAVSRHQFSLQAMQQDSVYTVKKKRDPAAETFLPTVDTTGLDAIRKIFLQSICREWVFLKSDSPLRTKVYVISSALQSWTEKITAVKNCIEQVKTRFPDMPLEMLWVNIPKDEFFSPCHFEKMKATIYHIPVRSVICFHTEQTFISP